MLTVSDGVMAGTREDRSGAALVETLDGGRLRGGRDDRSSPTGWRRSPAPCPAWRAASPVWSSPPAAPGSVPGTRRPKGTREVIERDAPGLAEAMRLVNPLGRLSRGVAGIRGHTHHPQHARLAEGRGRVPAAR